MNKAAQQQHKEMLFVPKWRSREDVNVLEDHAFCQLRNPWRY